MRFSTVAAAAAIAVGVHASGNSTGIHPTSASTPQVPLITSSVSGAAHPTGGNSTNGTISISKPTLSSAIATSASGGSDAAGASASSTQTGAANHLAASGAGLAALLGFAAYVL